MVVSMRVLIVEDEPVIGMELEDAVVEAGHEVIGWATGHARAIATAEARSPELARFRPHLNVAR
jgi:two-component system, response regulator PdtaR